MVKSRELHFRFCFRYARSSQTTVASPKVLTFCKNLQSLCTLLASLSQWEVHPDSVEYRQLQLLAGEKGRKFETSSTKDTRDICERIGQHLRG